MDDSKLDLSAEGFRLLTQRMPWTEKRLLVDRLYAWLGRALTQTKQRHGELFNGFTANGAHNGKITRGENYDGFPYVLLDYPNVFSKNEIVAARNLIWLGNGFHCTLHLRGAVARAVSQKLAAVPPRRLHNIRLFTGPDEWQHHVEPTNWKTLDGRALPEFENMGRRGWLKLGCEINIRQPDRWDACLARVSQTWADLLTLR